MSEGVTQTGRSIRAWAVRTLVASAIAGALLFGIETSDLVYTLWASFNTASEPFLFATYLAPDVLVGAAVCALLAVLLSLASLVRLGSATVIGRFVKRAAPALGALVAVVLVVFVLRVATGVAPEFIEEPLLKVARKVNTRLVRIPFVIENFSTLLTVGYGFIGIGLVGFGWMSDLSHSKVFRVVFGVVAIGFVGLAIGFYVLDSRTFFGRYEYSFHLPALAGQVGSLALAAHFATAALGSLPFRRAATIMAAIVIVIGVTASGFATVHIGENENLKALLWRRSVDARRAYAAVAFLWDRDGDGFSPLFDGGDLDDNDPNVHPFATEIAGNGIDDNCIGGDATSTRMVKISDPTEVATALPAGRARNLLLISIDTLRANRMSCYGYARETAPNLDDWRKQGVFYERAYSQASNTGLSFASMQRSALRRAVFDPGGMTLFGRLKAAGFQTTFINARRDDKWLETKRWTRYRSIILDGVDSIDHVDGDELWDADRVTDRTIEHLGSLPEGTRHATWVHYLDPHEPRHKMAPFDFGDSASDKYDSEIAFSDREVGRLLTWLEERGDLENTLVVLVSDHGEAFKDHGVDLHGNRPYDHQIHVPLIMWAPDVAPASVTQPVGVIDIAPSVISYFGLEPIPNSEGFDILRRNPPMRPVFSETPLNLVEVSYFAYAVTDGHWRYIYDVRGNTVELYDLASDPGEVHNLADHFPEREAALRAVLADWLDSTRSIGSLRELRHPE